MKQQSTDHVNKFLNQNTWLNLKVNEFEWIDQIQPIHTKYLNQTI